MYILHSTCTTNSWALLVRPATGTFNFYVIKSPKPAEVWLWRNDPHWHFFRSPILKARYLAPVFTNISQSVGLILMFVEDRGGTAGSVMTLKHCWRFLCKTWTDCLILWSFGILVV